MPSTNKKKQTKRTKNVKWVIGNEFKNDTAKLILSENTGVHAPKIKRETFFQEYSSFDPKHTRVNLKIQDGCDFYCSFCIIPCQRPRKKPIIIILLMMQKVLLIWGKRACFNRD